MLFRDRIEINPAICSGKPVIRGTRILVTSILSQLAAGESVEAICRGLMGLTEDDVRAAVGFTGARPSARLSTHSKARRQR